MHQFLEKGNYHHKLVPHIALILDPLHTLLKKKRNSSAHKNVKNHSRK